MIAETQLAAIAALRNYLAESQPYLKTNLLRQVAERMADLRAQCLTSDGEIDWRGAGWQYRSAAAEVYGMAGLRGDDKETVTSNLRYHIGNELRERLTAEELASAGLSCSSPRQKSVIIRARQQERLASVALRDKYEDQLRGFATDAVIMNG
jgi:hypothetical protein